MYRLIEILKNKNIHTPRLAIVRLLLAFSMFLTLTFNATNIIANHSYHKLEGYHYKHTDHTYSPFVSYDLFMTFGSEKGRIIAIVILLIVMTGILPQITSILHYWVCFSFHNYVMVVNAGDEIAFILSFLLIPICITDNRWNQWQVAKENNSSTKNIVAGISLFVIQLQAAWIYFDAGYFKLSCKVWKEGTAAYYYTSSNRLGAPDWLRNINEHITNTWMVKPITWGILLLELVLAFSMLMPKKIRFTLLFPALFFHFLILLNFGLITFFIAISAMLLLFLDADEKVVKWIYGKRYLASINKM